LCDEYVRAHPGILLTPTEEFGLKPDFFLMRRDAPLWDIAELKLPTEKLTTGRKAYRLAIPDHLVKWRNDEAPGLIPAPDGCSILF